MLQFTLLPGFPAYVFGVTDDVLPAASMAWVGLGYDTGGLPLEASATTVGQGDNVTLTAIVGSGGGVAPTGSVAFFSDSAAGSHEIGTANLVGGMAAINTMAPLVRGLKYYHRDL